jgi:hypothetical protein
MIKKLKEENTLVFKNKYYQCYLLIRSGKYKEALHNVIDNNLDLNYKSKFLPNEGTLYHMFGYYLREEKNKDKYLKLLFKIEEPRKITNNFDFTFEDMLKFDSSRLFSG